MHAVASNVSFEDGLDKENIHSPRAKWHPMDMHTTSDAGKKPALLQASQQVWALRSVEGTVKS